MKARSRERSQKRSDMVRARRSQRKRVKPAGRNKSAGSRVASPTVVRTNTISGSMASRRGRAARRRYSLSLGAKGAEMRLPAIPQMRVGWRLVSAGMTIGLIFLLYMVWTAAAFQVKGAEVDGLARVSPLEVNAALKVTGSSIFAIDPSALLETLQSTFPELDNVDVHVGFPAKVVVEAREREPLLLWEQTGLRVWVDADGVAFLPRGEAEGLVAVQAQDAPPMSEEAAEQNQLITPAMVTAILQLSEQAPEATALLYDPNHGLGWVDPAGWQVYFGLSPENMPARLAVYESIVEDLQRKNINPLLISVEYLHAPYYRLVP